MQNFINMARAYCLLIFKYKKWCLTEDVVGDYPDTTIKYRTQWVWVENGKITVKKGYAWNGCSPKWNLGLFVFGTPDGPINCLTGKQYCYYASLFHDALYQFTIGKREVADKLFFDNMLSFPLKHVYYGVVRATGWVQWNKNKQT